MKKITKYLSLLLILILVTTACGKKEENIQSEQSKLEEPGTVDDFKTAYINFRTVESYAMDINFDIDMLMDGSTIAMDMNMASEIDKNTNIHSVMNISVMGMSEEQEFYQINKEGKIISYTNIDGVWYYSEEPITIKDNLSDEELNEMINELDVKPVESDKEGYQKYVVGFSKEMLEQIMEKMPEESMNENEDVLFDSSIYGDFEFVFYIKDNQISIIELDLSNIMDSVIGEDTEIDAQMGVVMTIELKNYNKISEIVVPDEIIQNALPTDNLTYDGTEQL